MTLVLSKWMGLLSRLSSTTDIILTNHEGLIDNVTTMPGNFDSDHIPVTFTTKSSLQVKKCVKKGM